MHLRCSSLVLFLSLSHATSVYRTPPPSKHRSVGTNLRRNNSAPTPQPPTSTQQPAETAARAKQYHYHYHDHFHTDCNETNETNASDGLESNLERSVDAVKPRDAVISHQTACAIFFGVLATALIWWTLAFLYSRNFTASPALPSAAGPSTSSTPSRPVVGAARALIAAVQLATHDDWSTSVFDLSADFSGFCLSLWCPCARWADNAQRVGILDFESAKWMALVSSSMPLIALQLMVGIVLIIATHTNFSGFSDTFLTFLGVSCASGLAGVLWFAFGVLYTYYRQEARQKLAIWGPDTLEVDFGASCCCWPCAISQETRHLMSAAKDGVRVRAASPILSLHPFLGGSLPEQQPLPRK